MSWEPVPQVAKNDAGQFVALIGGKWEPVDQAAKNDAGEFIVMRSAKQARPQTELPPVYERTNIRGEKVSPNPLEDIASYYANVATGASGLMRGGANLLSDGLGEKIWPKAVGSQGSVGKTIGELADPVAMTIGGGVLKALPYAPVLGNGLFQGGVNLAKNAGAGALMGGAIGGLSDEGTMAGGAGTGAAINVVAPPLVGGATKLAGSVWDAIVGRYGLVNAGKIARLAAGGDAGAIKAASAAAPMDITATQAAAGVKNDLWDALGEIAKANDRTNYFSRLAEQQKQGRVGAMRGLAGGANQTEARNAASASQRTLNQITTPMRETELASANQGYLSANSVIGSIGQKLKDPSIGTNLNAQKAMSAVAAQINDWSKKNGGVIDAEALYGIRKNLNDTIESLIGTGDPALTKKAAASIAGQVRPLIDDAIERAGGSGWRGYLKTFEEGMRKIEQGKMAASGLQMVERQPAKFESLMAGNEPKAVKDVFGPTKYDIRKEMSPTQLRVMDRVAAELTRDRSIAEGAARGGQAMQKMLDEHGLSLAIPNLLEREIAWYNRIIKGIQGKLHKSTVDALMAGMKNGESAAKVLSALPTQEKFIVLKEILPYAAGGTVAASEE